MKKLFSWVFPFVALVMFVAVFVNAPGQASVTTPSRASSGPASAASEASAPAPAASAVSSPAAQKPAEWTRVGEWSGTGVKNTETFVTTTREWRVVWAASAGEYAGLLQVMVHDAETDRLVSLVANQLGDGADVSYVRTRAGRYYLTVNAANVGWSVSVQELR